MTIKIKQIGVCVGMAALMMAGAWLNTACSSDETIVENKPAVEEKTTPTETTVKFTATLAPKGDNGSGTRAITPGKDANNKETLNVAWANGEQIAVRYQTGSTTYATTTATVVGEPNADGSANIAATLTSPMDGGSVTFVYPATLANTDCDDIDESKLINQHGNLTKRTGSGASVDDISSNFDAATGSGTISVAAGTAVVGSKVTMNNRVCICKFKFTLDNGTGSGTSIGGGDPRQFNNLKIYDGNGHVYTITSDKTSELDGSPRGFKENEEIYVAMLPVSGNTVIFHYEQTVTGGKANYIKYAPSTTLAEGKFYRNLGTITLTKDDYNGVHIFKDLSKGNSIIDDDGYIIFQSNSTATSNTITIPNGATVTLAGVNISAVGSSGIICNGTANINLVGTNSVTSTANGFPGIQAGSGTLTINGSGSLTATGGQNAAAIGSGHHGTCGAITISGGNVTATGGQHAAAIGSGYNGTCGAIIISGGNVTATGGQNAAAIGSGYLNTCGTITISGGNVTATGGEYAAGIGSGYHGTCGAITISGGTIEKAIGGIWGAGIGSGYCGTCGAINISGGSIKAQAGANAAGIGSGQAGKYTSISIGSGITMVQAESGANNVAPIGKGLNDIDSGSVTIDNSTSWTAGTATEHLNWETYVVSGWLGWTLTHK